MTCLLSAHATSGDATHAITGELVIQNVEEVRQALLPLLAEPLCVDLSGVSAIDTAGLQLLVMAGRENIGFCHPSPTVEALLRFARLELPGRTIDRIGGEAS